MTPSTHQLLLVKSLFQRGQEALSEKRLFSAGVAVSHFQDAVELLLWATAVHVDAKPTEKFDGMWDSIKQGSKCPPGKELPLRSPMTSLNKARVGFKHYGVTPDAGEAAKFGAYAEEFLTVVFREFFGVDFAAFSLIEAIQNATVVSLLRAAEQALAKGGAVEAVEEVAKAHAQVDLELDRILPRLGFDFELFVARTVKPGTPGSKNVKRAEEVESVIQAQRNFIVATALNIRLADFIRFKRMVPSVFHVSKGMVVEWPTEEMRNRITHADAEFALSYAMHFAIAVERMVAGVEGKGNLAAW